MSGQRSKPWQRALGEAAARELERRADEVLGGEDGAPMDPDALDALARQSVARMHEVFARERVQRRVREVLRDGRRWLAATAEGVRDLGEWLYPPPQVGLAGSRRGAVPGPETQQALEAAGEGFPWIPVVLRAEDDRTVLVFKARTRPGPPRPPAVTVTRDGAPMDIVQQDYDPAQGRLRIDLAGAIPDGTGIEVSEHDASGIQAALTPP